MVRNYPHDQAASLTVLEEEQLRAEELDTLFSISCIFTTSGIFEDKVLSALVELARVCRA